MDSEAEPPVPFGTFRPTERRALIGCAFAAGCILLMPGELVGAGICFVLAGAFTVWHLVRSKRERARPRPPARRPPPPRAIPPRPTPPPDPPRRRYGKRTVPTEPGVRDSRARSPGPS
ncbi:MAG: hypothetical protein R3F14_06915 [Polyangiaceae bacterium]